MTAPNPEDSTVPPTGSGVELPEPDAYLNGGNLEELQAEENGMWMIGMPKPDGAWRTPVFKADQLRAYGDARAAAASQPAPASVGAEAEAMKMLFLDAAEAALNRHVVQGWTDSDGGPYPLIDFLTPEGRPVSEGMGEVRLMVHSILVEIDRRLDGTGSGIRIVESNAITDGDALIVQDGRPVAKITGLAGTGGE